MQPVTVESTAREEAEEAETAARLSGEAWSGVLADLDGAHVSAAEASRSGDALAAQTEALVVPRRRASRFLAVLALGSDVTAILVAMIIAFAVRPELVELGILQGTANHRIWTLLSVAWVVTLALGGAYDERVLGAGAEEFRRVLAASFMLLAVIATVSYLFRLELSRGFVLLTLPLGMAALFVGRVLVRQWTYHRRLGGSLLAPTLLIGPVEQTAALADTLRLNPLAGYEVVASTPAPPADGAGLLSWIDDIGRCVRADGIQAVALTQSERITNDVVRRLAWSLEGLDVDLLVAPVLGDIAGPRVTLRPAAGLPLIHLDEPQLTGPRAVAKRLFDLGGSVTILVLLSPLLLLVSVLVAATSRGPVLFRQPRIGRNGAEFTMLKFRTMRHGAPDAGARVTEPRNGDDARFQTPDDPRVTRIGRILRRWSIDELPQLLNVVGGSMSMVGPRPLMLEEARELPEHEERRHRTKPGLTGLWQISGRKETTWEERMRLDVHYVENWSPALDLVILIRTLKVVIAGRGAY